MTGTSPWGRREFLLASAGLALAPLAEAKAPPAARKRLGVVLGGGSARGFAHIGVIKALEAARIRPDVIVGCSAGSLVGAFWAAGYTGAQMEDLALRVKDTEVIDLIAGKQNYGMVSGRGLQGFVNQALHGQTIEQLPIPFAAVATRYPEGELVAFQTGDTGFAVRASCSIPGVFIPASGDGGDYLDGGLVSPIPVATARRLGAEVVLAVDVGGPDENADKSLSIYNVVMRSFEIMSQSLRKHETTDANVVVRPEVARVRSTDFSARKLLIALGQHAGARLVPVLRAKMGPPPVQRKPS